jgi:hypothetical protein
MMQAMARNLNACIGISPTSAAKMRKVASIVFQHGRLSGARIIEFSLITDACGNGGDEGMTQRTLIRSLKPDQALCHLDREEGFIAMKLYRLTRR